MRDKPLYRLYSATFFIMLTCLFACNIDQVDFNNVELPNYQAEFVGPLGSATFAIPELIETLEDEQINIDTSQAGLLSFVYTDTTIFDDLDEIVVLNNVNENGSISSPIDIPALGLTASIDTAFQEELEFLYPFDLDEQLDSMYFSQGTVTLTYQSNFSVPLDFTLTLNDITDRTTGEPLVISGTVGASSSGDQSLSLANYKVIATQNNSGENVFTGIFDTDITINIGEEVSLNDSFDFNLSFTGATFETIYGYFGNKETDIHEQSISFDFFNEIDSEISFNEPEVSFTTTNAFGLTFGVDLSEITASNELGQSLSLTGSVVDELQFINAPDISSVGEAVTSVISVNNENSNIRSLFEINPTMLTLSIGGQTNFSNIQSIVPIEGRNFINESSFITNVLQLTIPLEINLNNFSKDFSFEIGEIDLFDADTIGIRIKSINEIPIGGTFDLQFMSEDSTTVLYEIEDILAFASPEVSTEGIVTEPNENITVVPLFGEGLDAFEKAPVMTVQMNVESYNAADGQYVKIFYGSKIELIVGLEANLNIEL